MGKLTIQDISSILVERNGFLKKDAKDFATAMFSLIQERLETEQLVKVRGLGTFKIVEVEARESVSVRTGERVVISGHAKVTFTPDATMKELVNKPFSQFETVILNDGVEFEDMQEETEITNSAVDEEKSEGEVIIEKEQLRDVIVNEIDQAEQNVRTYSEITETSVEPETPVEPEAPVEPETSVEPEAPVEPEATHTAAESISRVGSIASESSVGPEEDRSRKITEHRFLTLWQVLAVFALMVLSAWGGYYYGTLKNPGKTVVVIDTVVMPQVDTVTVKTIAQQPKVQTQEITPDSEVTKVVLPQSKIETTKTYEEQTPVAEQNSMATNKAQEQRIDKYSQKDDRVRLGAYRIVGTEREVKVMPGQTFYSICKANLGPDMECYVEVYNNLPRNPKVKVGQIIKIPKLQVKIRRKK